MISVNTVKNKNINQGSMPGMDTNRHFSMGNWMDESRINFAMLRVFNDSYMHVNGGFDLHPHDKFDLITYVMDGTLNHEDTVSERGVIEANNFQYQSTGTGLMHREWNATDKSIHAIQMWFFPLDPNQKPKYEYTDVNGKVKDNELTKVISSVNNKNNDGLINIRTDVNIYLTNLTKDYELNIDQDRCLFVYVEKGEIIVDNKVVNTRESVQIFDEKSVAFEVSNNAKLLIIEMPYFEFENKK